MLPGPSFPRSHRSVPPPHCHSFSRSKFPRDPWLLVALRRLGFHFQPVISPRNRYYFREEEGKKRKWIGSHRPCNFLASSKNMNHLDVSLGNSRQANIISKCGEEEEETAFFLSISLKWRVFNDLVDSIDSRLEAFFDRSSDIRDFKGMGMGMVFLARFTFCLYAFLNASLWSYRCSITRTYISSRLLLRYSFH